MTRQITPEMMKEGLRELDQFAVTENGRAFPDVAASLDDRCFRALNAGAGLQRSYGRPGLEGGILSRGPAVPFGPSYNWRLHAGQPNAIGYWRRRARSR